MMHRKLPLFRQNFTLASSWDQDTPSLPCVPRAPPSPPVWPAGVSVSLGTTQPQDQEAQKGHLRAPAAQGSGGGETAGYAGGLRRVPGRTPVRSSVCLEQPAVGGGPGGWKHKCWARPRGLLAEWPGVSQALWPSCGLYVQWKPVVFYLVLGEDQRRQAAHQLKTTPQTIGLFLCLWPSTFLLLAHFDVGSLLTLWREGG